ncbi:MAG: hypothetical protein AAFV26_07640 [Pseudomonadota bacterium]
MSQVFYTHRLAKLLDEFVLGSNLTLTISDERSPISLIEHRANIEQSAAQKGVVVDIDTNDDRTIMCFRRR